MIELTKRAADKIKEIAAEECLQDQVIRVNIIGGGCAGLNFDLYFDSNPPTEEDVLYESHQVKIAVHQLPALYLDGTEIDYFTSVFSEGFRFNNSSFSSRCGCGNSFSL